MLQRSSPRSSRFHAVANKWDAVEALPDGLDAAQAVAYREVGPASLGGQHLVFGDQVWWERPDGQFQRSVLREQELAAPKWVRVDA